MATFHGIEYFERAGSFPGPSPKWNLIPRGQSRNQMKAWIDWSDLVPSLSASKAFLGYATVQQNYGGLATPKYIARSAPNGFNPFYHPDFPSDFYMGESFDVEGDRAEGVSARGTADFDEGNVVIGFTSTLSGYRCFEDADVLQPVPSIYAANPFPADYFLLRNVEIIEKTTAKLQTVQPGTGLFWDGPAPQRAVTAAAFVLLWESDITVKWGPIPIAAYNEAAFMALVNKTNDKVFPPSPPGAATSRMRQRDIRTLVQGMPEKEEVHMGDCLPAYMVTIKYKYYPSGASTLWRHDPPTGSPRFMAVVRPDGSPLREAGDFAAAYIPP
jgi:hypothetical protein